jgi:hypothetical protein
MLKNSFISFYAPFSGIPGTYRESIIFAQLWIPAPKTSGMTSLNNILPPITEELPQPLFYS